jgi:hypothetical protein
MEEAFPEAMVSGYEKLISAMENDPKDRHVLAAAVRAGADCIVSDNVKDFQPDALRPYGLECLSAQDFLLHQYHLIQTHLSLSLWNKRSIQSARLLI